MSTLKDKNGLTEAEFLSSYHADDFVHPSVAADMVIFTVTDKAEENYRKLPEKELSILLIQRGIHPFLGAWALPGGFVRPGETTENTARRELEEETGLSQVYLEQLYTFSDPERDPRTWVISCSYMTLIDNSNRTLKAGDDADCAAWFGITCNRLDEQIQYENDNSSADRKVIRSQRYELQLKHEEILLHAIVEKKIIKKDHETIIQYRILENHGLAFDHAKIIFYALERLRGKVEYTDLALNLMPSEFTLTQLQQVYEVILDKKLLKAAFRRKVTNLVEETDSYTKNEGHRPSRLYRRKIEV